MAGKDIILLATRKGLVEYVRTASGWQLKNHWFAGIPVSMVGSDERSGNWWAMLDHGHWGCKLHVSPDRGDTWEEIEAPKYPEGEEIKDGVAATLQYFWGFACDGDNGQGRLFFGTDPGGLFVSHDNGASFTLNRPLWDRPERKELWFGGGRDNPGIHSILIDPRDSDHIYVAISCAGVFETTDGGENWQPRNRGLRADYLPNPDAEVGHDVHLLAASPVNFDIMWQQNHFGVYRSTDGGTEWTDVSEEGGPARFGFTIAVDEQDADVAWVIPATADEYRMAIDGALQVCRTDDGGKTWKSFRHGLPQENCFDLIYRHALAVSGDTLFFGSTTGNIFVSEDRGESWHCLNTFLPAVYACAFV